MEYKKSPHSERTCLDEQMMLSDPQTALLFQIREELRELNHNLKYLNKPPEPVQKASKTDAKKVK